jgi:hypothetical protein
MFLLRCAGQVPPPGGDIDRDPPRIIRTEPDTNTVRVETDRIVLEFSEYVDRRSVEQSIFISPYPGTVEYDWSGTEVTVLFSSPLRAHRTYVVSVGTDVIDRRERNRMAAGFSLAFSTGDSIDQGFISGRVFDEKPDGVLIFAYPLDSLDADTLNPGTLKPEYVTQTGHGGTFTLSNLRLGRYRVIAVRDEYHDYLYGKQIDRYGVPLGDVALAPDRPHVDGLRMRLAVEDTSRPFVSSARITPYGILQVRFSEPIDSLSLVQAEFDVRDTISGRSIPLDAWYLQPMDSSTVALLPAAPLDSGTVVRISARRLTDRAGNILDSLNAAGVATVGARADTSAPGWRLPGIADSARGISLSRPLQVVFTEPVQKAAAAAFTLADTGGRPVMLNPAWLNPVELLLTPDRALLSGSRYDLRVVLDSIRDLHGNARRDSTAQIRFVTMDMKRTGTIEGWVRDSTGKGEVTVVAQSVQSVETAERRIHLAGPGAFAIQDLPEGFYALWAFRDEDRSGGYSPGLPYPFRPSEPFAVSADTVKVRARWGVEGVVLKLR